MTINKMDVLSSFTPVGIWTQNVGPVTGIHIALHSDIIIPERFSLKILLKIIPR